MSTCSESSPSAPDSTEFESRFPRRLLFAGAAAGLAGTAVIAGAAPAQAASATTPWMLGGNSGVTTSNFIGPTTAGVPLIFKTKANSTSAVVEKMRLTADGKVGIGVTSPAAKLDIVTSGTAVQGKSIGTTTSGRGLLGSSPNGYGVQGTSTNNVGVRGEGTTAGVSGKGNTYGIVGEATSYGAYLNGGLAGVYASGGNYGVLATGATGVSGSGVTGVSGYSTDANSNGVYGSGGQYGVHGVNARTAGVRGDSGYVGVWGEAPTYALFGSATATTGQVYGVYGTTASPNGYAVFAQGNAHVNGTLSKAAGSFRIDHPLDPDKKWLSHSFVESPDMMNIYNGNVTTDGSGTATVGLPAYFAALNRDFRYQLTVIGDFAQVVVSKEVANNSFAIRTDKPNVKVSWQVTGIRQDSYAAEHPIVVETAKTGTDAGTRQFVPKGSTAKAAPTGPGSPSASITPASPADVAKPQDKAAGTTPAPAY
ncbi:hypothetical protein [Subtercola boreus]|nr:hypothetical protein [Subtercola boreus]